MECIHNILTLHGTLVQTDIFAELDVCVYLMSNVGVQMEIEEGANSTVTDIINSLHGEEELGLPRAGGVQVVQFIRRSVH